MKALSIVLLLALTVLVFTACGDDDEDADVVAKADKADGVAMEDDKFGGTLRVVSQASVRSLDTIFVGAYVSLAIADHIYEIPFAWDDQLNIVPKMTDTWEVSSDGKVYTFTNRKDLVFHNGDPVTSADMVASLQRWLGAQYPQANLMRDRGARPPFEVVDDRTYKVNIAQPYGEVIPTFARVNRIPNIVPKSLVDASPTQSEELPETIGNGPYKLDLFEQGNRIVLVRHEDYVPRTDQPQQHNLGGSTVPYIDKIEWLEIPEEETKVAGLETGEWDVVDGASFDFLKRLQGNDRININFYKPGHKTVFTFNHNNPPMDNKLVRQAILAVMDVDAIMSAWGPQEAWRLCPAWFWCGTPQESRAAEDLYNQKDPAKAKRLLDEAGYDGEQMTIMNPSDYGTITPTGIILKQLMEDAGFNVESPAMDWATLVSKIPNHDQYHIFTNWRVHWGISDLLPDPGVSGAVAYLGKPNDLIALRLEYLLEADPAERKSLMDQIQVGIYDFVPELRLGEWFSIYPSNTVLKNFEVKSLPFYFNSWLER
jgi:peptide/nickel transport system substrate-binding protein